MATENLNNAVVANALDSLGMGRDILEYLTSVTEHSDSVESHNGRATIIQHALDYFTTAEGHIKAISTDYEDITLNDAICRIVDAASPQLDAESFETLTGLLESLGVQS